MNYKKLYEQLVEKRRKEDFDGYGETHHIIPKCLGGTDEKENLVRLTAREHFIAHVLLCKIYPSENKLWFAFNGMCNKWGKNKDYKIANSKFYESCRLKARKIISESNKGEKNGMYGKPSPNRGKRLSEDVKRRISENLRGEKNGMYGKKRPSYIGRAVAKANKERIWLEESRAKLGLKGKENPWYGKHITQEMKDKMRLSKCYRQLQKFPSTIINVDDWDSYNTHGCIGFRGILKDFGNFDNMLIQVNKCFNTHYIPTHSTVRGLLIRKGLISYSQCKNFENDFEKFKTYYSKFKQLYEEEVIAQEFSDFLDSIIDKLENN